MTALLSAGESWRVAALTMMDRRALAAALSGENAAQWVAAAAACGFAERGSDWGGCCWRAKAR